MDCRLIAHEDIAERYLVGRLPPEQQAAYEQHFFECDACYSELRRLVAIREALESAPTEAPEPRRSFGYFTEWWHWPAIAAVAASVIGVALLVRQHEAVLAPPSTAVVPLITEDDVAPPAAPGPDASLPEVERGAMPHAVPAEGTAQPPGEERAAIIARIAAVQPPRYDPPVLRGMHDAASTAFRAAMRAYVAGDYAAALTGLRKASAADPKRPDIAFYLGATELLADRPEQARVELERLIAMGDTVFSAEAHFYLGKSLLRLGHLDEAQQAFLRAAGTEGTLQAEAQTVLDALARLDPTPQQR